MLEFKAILGYPFYPRQKKLALTRQVMGKDGFIADISSSEAGRKAAALLWDHLLEWIVYPDFKPDPEDNLLDIYGLYEEDLDEDIILDILLKFGCKIPTQDQINKFGYVNTVGDIIAFIEYCCDLQLNET